MTDEVDALRSVRAMVFIYALVAAVWILASDVVVGSLTLDPLTTSVFSTLGGWGFVLISSALLYWQLGRMACALRAARARERALADEQGRIRSMLDAIVAHSTEAIFVKDVDSRYLVFNAESAKVTGCPQETALLHGDRVVFGSEQARLLRDDDRRLMARPEPETRVEELDTQNGRRRFVTLKGALRTAAGEVIGVFGMSRDVTERMQTEEAAARWVQVFQSAQLGFALQNVGDNTFAEVNEAYARLHGYGVDELRGKPIIDVYAPEERASIERRLEGIDAAGQQIFESVHLHKDGHRIPVLMGITPIRDADGRVRSRFGYAIDYTEHKAADLQLRKLSQAVEQSPESIVITNLCAEIEYVNAAFVRATGYTREEVIGQNPRVLQSRRTPQGNYDALWNALQRGEAWRGEFYNRRKDGSEYCEMANIAPIRNEAGEITHYLAVKEDITERKRLNEELAAHREHLEELVERRTAELAAATRTAEAANRAKSDFLATMSHELRTPMNGVVGIAEILRQSGLSEHQVELVDTMRESAFSLLHIIDDILDFSKIEAGRLELVREPFALRGVVEGVGDALQPMAARKKVELRVFVAPTLPEVVLGDELRLRQILNNLVGNAIKFSAGLAHPGAVRIRAEADAAGQLRIDVSDNGIGMTPEVMAQLFTPFTQAEASTTRRYGGTGLGLAICQRLAALLGGRIEVASEYGVGSRFTAIMPLVAAATGRSAAPGAALDGVHCFIVGRDAGVVRDWSTYLAHAGANVRVHAGLDAARQAMAQLISAEKALVTDMAAADDRWHALREAFAAADAGLVVVPRGARRRPRRELERVVSVDGDAMRRDALIDAVALAVGRLRAAPSPRRPDPVPATMPVVPTVDEAVAAGRLILVAEDDPINRKVIELQLVRLGLACEFGNDGVEALKRWRSARHALLLTDLHMPKMDGYELTAAIRREEPAGRHIPIIALTANALRGEDARCKSAGMDDYLSKPVLIDVLRETLARWLPATAAAVPLDAAQGESAAPSAAALPVLDTTVLAGLVGDDRALIDEFLQEYRVSVRAAADGIRSARSTSSWKQIGALAHQLKSSSRSVGALALGEICAALEQAGKSDRGEEVAAQLPIFEHALAQVVEAIEHSL